MFELHTSDDLDLDRIADSGQCFRWERTGDRAYRIVHRAHCVTAQALGEGRYRFSCGGEEFRDVWQAYFALDEDYRAIRARVRPEEDPYLYAACEAGRGIRILRQDPWETLVSFIISQNKNIPAIKKSIALLCEAAGEEQLDDAGRPYRVFPSPEAVLALTDGQLSACRLGYRCGYVRAAAEAVAGGQLDLDRLAFAPDDEAMAALMSVRGVGPKVASCAALFGLHHTDAFPVDVWIRRVLEEHYPSGWPMEKYSPYNGIYQQYLFYASRIEAGAAVGQ